MSNIEIKNKKIEALDVLDRTIGFINNCDNKASIALGLFGVLLTIIFTSDGIVEYKKFFTTAISCWTVCDYIFIAFLAIFLISFIIGICNLFRVLVPNLEPTKINSILFFGSIANQSVEKYKEKILNISDDNYLNDIIHQIHKNSVICNQKFRNFKRGYIFAGIGMIGIIIMFTIGYFIYQVS